MYPFHVFLISSASGRSLLFCRLLCPSLDEISLDSDFPEEISSLSHSIVFLYSFAVLIQNGLSLLAVLWNSAFRWIYLSFSPLPFTFLLLSAVCKVSSDNHFAFWISFSWGWFWSPPPVQCYKPPSIVLQTLRPSDLIPWIYLSLPLYHHKGFDLGHTWMV